MIYLIDEKKTRQAGYGWSSEIIETYANAIKPIYIYSEEEDKRLRNEIFAENNIILFHESFFDSQVNTHKKKSLDIRNDLENYALNNSNFLLAIFSGSKNTRSHDSNVIHLPVATLYQNLEVFVNKIKEGKVDLRHLLFGANPEIEEGLINKLEAANKAIDELSDYDNTAKNLFVRPNKRYLQRPLQRFDEVTIYNQIEDSDISTKITEWLSNHDYDNIFVPICFGPTLSDFNGLRFATHVRCTNTRNQLKNIFLYSFVDYEYLINNKYFDILKTKNVFLIDHKISAFTSAVNSSSCALTIEELPRELKKIKLEPPENYEDSHSIANEWAIMRWSTALGISDITINKNSTKISNNLYYKFLSTIYSAAKENKIIKDNLILNNKGKILYIDDEAEKGWYEIFCYLLFDLNQIALEHLDDEFNGLDPQDIIDLCLLKVKNFDPDVVILDLRLHNDDFIAKPPLELTGAKILLAIKNLNRGIQVIIFSATNKVWNLKALQGASADGFITKESPENKVDKEFTTHAIRNTCIAIDACLGKSFLKECYGNLEKLKSELIPRTKYKISPNPLPKEFVDEVLKWTELSYDFLGKGLSQSNLTASFLFLFSVIENISNFLIDIDNPIEKIDTTNNERSFVFEFRVSRQKLRRFIEDPPDSGVYRKSKKPAKFPKNISWINKILNVFDFISAGKINEKEVCELIRKRHDIIHANTTTGNIIEIDTAEMIVLNSYVIKLLQNI